MYTSKDHHKKIRIGKKLFVTLLVVALGFSLFVIYVAFFANNTAVAPTIESTSDESESSKQSKSYVRLVATGDTIPHDALNEQAKNADNSYDFLQFMDNMKPLFDASDVNFCNQAVLGGGEEFGITGYPIFNSPKQIASDMGVVGCNVINTGTNHTNDLTQAAIDASVGAWDDVDTLAVAGANKNAEERDSVRYFVVDGIKFAFVSYTTYSNAPDVSSYSLTNYSQELAQGQLLEAEEKADITIVSMRWGTEYSDGVNQTQRLQAEFLTRNGADIILGHGPHVVAPFEKITEGENTAYVWYSLGNFLHAQLEVETLFNGFAVMDIDKETKEISVSYVPIYMHYEWTAQEAEREDLLARKNFELYTLDEAEEPLSRSQLDTTVDEQRTRLTTVLNSIDEVKLITTEEYYR